MKSLEILSSSKSSKQNSTSLSPSFSTLVLSLSNPSLNWSSFHQFAFPIVLTQTSRIISSLQDGDDAEGVKVLEFLNDLNKNGKFDGFKNDESNHSKVEEDERFGSGKLNQNERNWIRILGTYVLKGLKAMEERIQVSSKDQGVQLKFSRNDINLIELSTLFKNYASSKSDQHAGEGFSGFADPLRASIESLLDIIERDSSSKEKKSFESQGPLNNYFLLSSLVSSLNSMIYSCSSSSKSSKPSPSSLFYSSTSSTSNTLVSRVLSLASWHKPTLISLADLLETLSLKSISIPLPLPKPHEIVDSLTNAFMSGDGERRLSSLKVLKECESFHQKDGGLYEKVLEVEKIELSVEMIRDRNVRMRNLGREVERLSNLKSNSISEEEFKSSVNSVIKYLVGSFKLNFKPVWEESRKTLIDLSASIHWEKQVWDISFNEMLICGNENVGTNQENQIPEVEWNEVIRSLASKTNLNSGLDEDHEEEEEEDRSEQEEEEEVDPDAAKQFIDPQLSSRRKAIRSHLSAHLQKSEISLPFYEEVMDKQRFNERLDLINYEAQVLALYEKIPRTVEKNNKEFLEVFFERVPYRPEEDEDEEIEEEEEAEVEEDQEDSSKEDEEKEEEEIGSKQIAKPISKSSSTPKLSLLQRRSRLCSYLSVFSKFGNPKALSRSAELHSFLYELCSLGDAKVQKLALDCVLTWKNPSQTPYAERMKNLLDPSKFRDELTGFTLSSEADFEAGLGGGKPKGNKGGFKESNKEIKVQENDRQHLMPLVLRLFFGQMVSRRGKNTSGAGQAARKTAILIALVGCPGKELGTLVDLMLDAFDDQKPTFDSEGRFQLAKEAPKASTKRQIGFLSLLGDVLKHLGLVLVDYWPQLIGVTLNLTNYNQQKASQGKGSITQPARNIRQLGLKRLAEFFKKPIFFDWKPFLSIIFSEIVSPKLSLLRVESIQNPSALLDLIHTWSSKSDTIHLLVSGDKTLLPNLYACLNSTGVKPLVITRILDVVERALTVAEEEKQARGMGEEAEQENVLNSIVRPYVSSLLSNIGPLVHKTSSLSGAAAIASQKDILLKREISLLSAVAPFVTLSADASELLRILSPMVKKGNKVVNEKTKVDLLGIFRDLLLLTPEFRDSKSETFKIHYDLFSGLFASLRSRAARISLVEAFVQFKEIDGSLEKVTGWTKALNSFSTKRLEEYDFDKRLDAFDEINSEIENFHLKLTSTEWLPLLHNMIHFVQDEQELAIRSNAGTTLKRFVQAVSTSTSSDPESEETLAKKDLFLKVVYPGLRKALRSKSELVRREVLGVLAVSVETLGDVGALDEMRGLLADGDAEASFFNNIHHIQVHRRARALRRLGDEASKGVLKSKTISDVLAPLIGHFLNPENVELHDPNLVNETIACLGRLSKQLGWSNYNNLLWRYLRLANEKSAHEKVYVRASMSILDGFHFSMEEQAEVEVKKERSEGDGDAEGEAKEDEEDEGDDEAVDSAEVAAAQEAKARSVKILDAVTGKLLPSLMNYLSQKDDTDDAVRLPIAVGVVKVAKCLPPAKREAHIHKLLNTLANVLKSKAQDTRDLGRETLWKVSLQLGPSYFPAMVKELRRSLTRGPQLAVLAFTVHALLVHMMTSAENALVALDQGIEDVVHVATEDIFGHTAEDRDDPGYKSKMREVRQSKSMDTFEQLSKIVVPHRMNSVLLPLRDIMQQTEILKAMKSIDDVLRRVAAGINANLHFDSSALLVLCHTLISRNAAFLQPRKQTGAKVGAKGGPLAGYKFAVLLKRKEVEAAQGAGRDHYARNAHRFVAFGLDLLVTALRRARFDFADNQVLAKIDPMVSAVGNTLYATEFGVLNLGLKATGGLLKCPVPSLPPSLPIFLKQIFAIIHRSGTAQSDITQTALKTLTSILRECKDADIKEKQLTELLALILPDLEEPIAQSTLFGLLRAIVTRRFVVPEVYDVMDKVAEMLVTNQSGQVRELCRATFLQFLLDYPQGKGRLKNQMAFLAKNLSYVYESGRLSVMDLISAIFSKFSDDVIREHSDLFFVALVMVLANDESSKCRETGSKLLRTLVGMLEENQLNKSIQMTHAWSGQTERQELSKVGMQVYGILLEGAPDFSSGWLPKASQNIGLALKDCADDLETLETSAEYGEDQMDLDVDWQLPYQALQALTKIHKVDASLVSEETWDSVRRLLLFPHKWVRIAASRLLGSLYSTSTPVAPSMTADIKDPLSFVALTDCAKKLSLQLRSSILDDNLSLQIVKNLLFIGKSLALIEVRSKQVEDLEQAVQENGAPGEEGEDPENEMDRDDEEDDSEDEEEQIEAAAKIDNSAGIVENPLAWLFSKLSHQARSSQLSRKPSGPEVSSEQTGSLT